MAGEHDSDAAPDSSKQDDEAEQDPSEQDDEAEQDDETEQDPSEQDDEAEQDGEAEKSRPKVKAPDPERPLFAWNYPNDPELLALLARFEAGNYAAVREGVPRLVAKSKSEHVKTAAADLLRRTQPPPLVVGLLLLAFGLLAYLAYFYFSHQHEVVR